MSRAFVKEVDGMDFTESLPERPVSTHANFVTGRGLGLIDEEVATYRHALAEARSGNDRTAIARAIRELNYWMARRASARLVTADPVSECAGFGDLVTIERDDGRVQTFRIVGEDEADPPSGRISWIAPIAKAAMGREVGDEIAVPGGSAEITAIDRTPEPS